MTIRQESRYLKTQKSKEKENNNRTTVSFTSFIKKSTRWYCSEQLTSLIKLTFNHLDVCFIC